MANAKEQHARTRDIGFEWKFTKGDPADAEKVEFDDSTWRQVNVPHDWSIEGPKRKNNPGSTRVGYFPSGIGWYRKSFDLPAGAASKRVCVQFDGVYRDSQVWINGHLLGRRPYGYSSFQYDLTLHLNHDGANLLAVRVNNSAQPNSRWYTGSGIYRNVRLVVTDALHVAHWGVSVTTPEVSPDNAVLRVETEVANDHAAAAEITLVTRLINPAGDVVDQRETNRDAAANSQALFVESLSVSEPVLWSIERPRLYRIETIVKHDGRVVDQVSTTAGIRTARFDKDRGFLLNGQPVELKGVNLHHDGGSLGAAVPVRAWERRLEVLKSIGCNAIRTSHNPPAPELLDLCDRMGFVVIDEAFDKWGKPYNRSFSEWGRRDLVDMIRRDRNHPCVVLWSVGNEVTGQGSEAFNSQLRQLVGWTREADPTRPVTVALKPFKPKSREDNARKVTEIARLVDVISCNYQEQWFEDYRRAYPEVVILASESYAYYRGRGLSYKAFYPRNSYLDAKEHDYVVGTFYWTGIDYLGEAVAGWPFHGWNGSLIDTCGWVRPVGQLVKSFWVEEPMVHIAVMDKAVNDILPTKDHWGWPPMRSHWNLPGMEGKKVKVATFTNCDEVELLVNGQSLGRKRLEDFPDRMIVWETPYSPGVIEARGINAGHAEASHALRTAGEPAQLRLIADRNEIQADGRDLCYIDVEIVDQHGALVPAAAHKIAFKVEGPGQIVGVDNGDITSMEPYQGTERSAFHGRAQVIVQSLRRARQITLTASADGLPTAQFAFDASRVGSSPRDESFTTE